ncbi:MAG: hypothetical protein ACI9MC_001225 [Kiritimatiellia bacterium]|jgi:uncharacterized protein YdiU (UPF0061 family)
MQTLNWDDRFVRDLPGESELRPGSRQVLHAAWSTASATPIANPKLLAWSPSVAALIGLRDAPPAQAAEVFSGNKTVAGMRPYASCYGGHQFGSWAGQLGDGRAITLGEVVHDGVHWELQLKGAGPTPYSRGADGRAVMRSSIREYLCSEAMHHLGVPTTRALSLVGTSDRIERDMFYDGRPAMEPGAVVCRAAQSFLRFGSYQIHSARRDERMLSALIEHTISAHFPHLGPMSTDTVLAWLHEVARSTAHMVSEWMRVGFVHGVMNTDNMSILGLTMDYGPYGWMDAFDPHWTPNTSDAAGKRYRYIAQPQVAGWNLARLAEATYPIVQDVPALEAVLETYAQAFTHANSKMISNKLGFIRPDPNDTAMYDELLDLMTLAETDMTLCFRALTDVPESEDPLTPLLPSFYDVYDVQKTTRDAWRSWLTRYRARLSADGTPHDVRRARMHAANPKYVLRNYLAQEAIELAEAGDLSRVHELQQLLLRPYDEQPTMLHAAQRRPDWARDKPGCSELSCSS